MTHPLQTLVDSMNEMDKRTRADYHLTLGELRELLMNLPNQHIPLTLDRGGTLANPHSYRGYDIDLAWEPFKFDRSCAEVLKDIKRVLNTTLEGYKGGDFLMDDNVPMWVSPYGTNSQIAILKRVIINDAYVELTTLEVR